MAAESFQTLRLWKCFLPRLFLCLLFVRVDLGEHSVGDGDEEEEAGEGCTNHLREETNAVCPSISNRGCTAPRSWTYRAGPLYRCVRVNCPGVRQWRTDHRSQEHPALRSLAAV